MSETQYETDPFLKLLTDALRAGPGSPQWHEAVTQLRAANPAEADEYRLLIAARENLESGREYRSVRAGPGFTKKVMDAIDQDAGPRSILSANLIALLAAAGILGVVIIIAVMVFKNPPSAPTVEDLARIEFVNSEVLGDFSQAIPGEWRKFGVEPVISPREKGLRSGNPRDGEKEYRGGGVHLANPIPAQQPFAVEAAVKMQKTGPALQIFITDQPTFTPPTAATASELAIDLRDGQLRIFMPDGKQAGDTVKIDIGKPEPRKVLVKLDREFAIVEIDRKQVYAGRHGLSLDKPRHPGIRFLTKGPGSDDLTVSTIRILKP